MPELPDLTLYREHLERRLVGARLVGLRVAGSNLLRSVQPAPQDAVGERVGRVGRVGKRLVIGFDGGLAFVLHLMVAGRLQWSDAPAPPPRLAGKSLLASFAFSTGTLVLTEAGSKKRAGLWVVIGDDAVAALDPGGVEPLGLSLPAFAAALLRERHTLKRALTDPRLFAAIGNAYSDEILHAARLSPLQMTTNLTEAEVARLHEATGRVLGEWIVRLRAQAGEEFPRRVTAFRPEMAVHGRFGQPCPECGAAVQRIVYADNETDYCAVCQTGGRRLADRALSRLLRDDWPRRLEG